MQKHVKISRQMYNLLIKKEMDLFSVSELRDALMKIDPRFTDKIEARKYVYRRLLSFEKKGWLSVKGHGQYKRYTITDLFKNLMVKAQITDRCYIDTKLEKQNTQRSLNILLNEKNGYKKALAITQSELDEYQLLIERFPENKATLMPLFLSAKENATQLIGKINAISNYQQAIKQ